MLRCGATMYLLIPSADNKKVLHPGKVLEVTAERYVAEFEEALTPAVESDVNSFAENNGKFFQQGAVVAEVRVAGPKPVIAFRRNGEIVSAEQRQIFRVCTVATEIFAKIGNENKCAVVDTSPEGFAAVVKGTCSVGSVVPVLLNYEGQSVSGMARVQTAQVRPDGKTRYGFLVPKTSIDARKALRAVSGLIQRSQLRRLAGAA